MSENPLPQAYVTRQVELDKFDAMARAKGETPNGKGVHPLLVSASAGNQNLFDALWSFWNFSQAFDDLIDESGVGVDEKEVAFVALHEVIVSLLFRQKSLRGLLLERTRFLCCRFRRRTRRS